MIAFSLSDCLSEVDALNTQVIILFGNLYDSGFRATRHHQWAVQHEPSRQLPCACLPSFFAEDGLQIYYRNSVKVSLSSFLPRDRACRACMHMSKDTEAHTANTASMRCPFAASQTATLQEGE